MQRHRRHRSHMKPNDLVSCLRDGLIDRPFSLTAASQTPAAKVKKTKNSSPGLEQDIGALKTLEQAFPHLRGSFENVCKVYKLWSWTSHPFMSQETTMLLCYDRSKTNHCYYISQRSAPHSHIHYIRGQGVMFQPINHQLCFSFLSLYFSVYVFSQSHRWWRHFQAV